MNSTWPGSNRPISGISGVSGNSWNSGTSTLQESSVTAGPTGRRRGEEDPSGGASVYSEFSEYSEFTNDTIEYTKYSDLSKSTRQSTYYSPKYDRLGTMSASTSPDLDQLHDRSQWSDRSSQWSDITEQRSSRPVRKAAPSPLHERTPSQNNRQSAGIRMVPYSPPRLDPRVEVRSDAGEGSTPAAASTSASASASIAPSIHSDGQSMRSQRRGLVDNEYDDDSDRAATTPSKRASRRTSWASRASRSSWGPSAAIAALASAAARPGSPASSRGSIKSSSKGSTSRGKRNSVIGGRVSKTGQGGNGGIASNAGTEGTSPKRKNGNDDWDGKENKEGYAAGWPGSALLRTDENGRPLAHNSTKAVSGTKLASKGAGAAGAPSPLSVRSATSPTPGSSRHLDWLASRTSNITAVNAQALPAHQQQRKPQARYGYDASASRGSRSTGDAGSPKLLSLPFLSFAASSSGSSPYLRDSTPESSHESAQIPDAPPDVFSSHLSPSSSATSLHQAYHSLSPSASVASFASTGSSQPGPRPLSRRRNLITVHADKTFSLVPRGGNQIPSIGSYSSSAYSQSLSNLPAVVSTSASGLPGSLTGNLTSSLTTSNSTSQIESETRARSQSHSQLPSQRSPVSPPQPQPSLPSLKSASFTSAVRSSISHEQLSSDFLDSDDHPSSPLTNSATLPDRKSLSPATPSPASSRLRADLAAGRSGTGAPTTRLSAGHTGNAGTSTFSADFSSSPPSSSDSVSPWNYRLVGGLRKVPKSDDLKLTSAGLPLATYTTTDTITHTITETAFPSSATPIAYPPQAQLPKKSSLASVQSAALSTSSSLSFSASTTSAATNYKVYAHSSSPLPQGESQDSLALLPSSSHSANIDILGVSSSPAPPLPTLRRSVDPDQTFASFATFGTAGSSTSGSSDRNVVVLASSSPPASAHLPARLRRPRGDSTLSVSSTISEDSADSAGSGSFIADLPSSPPYFAPRTADSGNNNYVLHGEPSTFSLSQPPPSSSSNSSSLVTVSRGPRPTYSQESLVVPPLQPGRKRSHDKFGYYKSRSRESLRHAPSIKSISSILTQDAASTFFAGQAFLNLNIPPVPVVVTPKNGWKQTPGTRLAAPVTAAATIAAAAAISAGLPRPGSVFPKRKPLPLPAPAHLATVKLVERSPSPTLIDLRANLHADVQANRKQRSSEPDIWESSPPPTTLATTPLPPPLPPQSARAAQMMEEHPHVWSSQLSTVMSESEADSIDSRVISRPMSTVSETLSGNGRGDASARRSSVGWASSTHSRNRPSISSSLALQLDEVREQHSRSDSLILDRLQPVHIRSTNVSSPATSSSNGVSAPTVRNLDEHGDGLADLQDIARHQTSRTGLSALFSNGNASSRNLHSSSSSRSIGSNSIPSWARVYYGSGEHRNLNHSNSFSDLGSVSGSASRPNSRPNSAFRRSPSVDPMPLHIFNRRRRPHEMQPGGSGLRRTLSDSGSMEIHEVPPIPDDRLHHSVVRKMTSSIWSPHLRVDRRANRFSVWDPPSVSWSAQNKSVFDRRNIQLVLFTVGFVFPFAWMIAALLPLPNDPQRSTEKQVADAEFGVPAALQRRMERASEVRYLSARWWRTLNRVMSVFGLLILGAVVALVVVGVRQGWGQRN